VVQSFIHFLIERMAQIFSYMALFTAVCYSVNSASMTFYNV